MRRQHFEAPWGRQPAGLAVRQDNSARWQRAAGSLLLLSLAALAAVAAHARTAQAPAAPERAGHGGAPASPERLVLRLDVTEPEAALAILDRENDGQPVRDEDWRRLFDSPGYVRLLRREAAFKSAAGNNDWKRLLQDRATRDQAGSLRATLAAWRQTPLDEAAARAFAYLPAAAHIRATIYPVIKASPNSFVFEADTDPAIFLFLNPRLSAAQFTNKVAHELHHIGLDSSCPPAAVRAGWTRLPVAIASLHRWLGAFGEGHAMLAAAGGPRAHPITASDGRAVWEANVAHFDRDLAAQNQLFVDILEGRLTDPEQIDARMAAFFGEQGPWYTVGWKMDVTIEEAFGRDRLIAAMCDADQLLAAYNAAAARLSAGRPAPLARWSPDLAARLGG